MGSALFFLLFFFPRFPMYHGEMRERPANNVLCIILPREKAVTRKYRTCWERARFLHKEREIPGLLFTVYVTATVFFYSSSSACEMSQWMTSWARKGPVVAISVKFYYRVLKGNWRSTQIWPWTAIDLCLQHSFARRNSYIPLFASPRETTQSGGQNYISYFTAAEIRASSPAIFLSFLFSAEVWRYILLLLFFCWPLAATPKGKHMWHVYNQKGGYI